MPSTSDDSVSREGRPQLDNRYVGKFILWVVIVLVGWSFYHTEKHGVAIAVIQQKLEHIDQKITIDQRLRDIQDQIKDIKR